MVVSYKVKQVCRITQECSSLVFVREKRKHVYRDTHVSVHSSAVRDGRRLDAASAAHLCGGIALTVKGSEALT